MSLPVPRREFLSGIAALGIIPTVSQTPECQRRPRGRHAVYVATVAGDFCPRSAADHPAAFGGPIVLLSERHALQSASRLAHAFNRQQLRSGLPIRQWALVVARCREEKHLERNGGAA